MRMDKLLKIGTGIISVLAVVACLSTVGIVGYALVGGVPDKSPEEVYQAEMQAHNEETQNIHVLNEAAPTSSGTQTPLYDEHIHNYTESMDVKADCYREGRLKYTCDTCGDIYYIDVPMTGHKPDDEWAVTREATPDLVGLRVKYCIYCDQIVAIEDIPYTLEENNIGNENHIHIYTSTIEREPTCIFAGLREYTCSCGSSYTELIHAPGHVASDWEVAAEATTTHKGIEQRMCRVCGVLLDSRPIDAKRESPNPANTAAPTETPTRMPEQTSAPTPKNTPMPTNVPTQRPIVTPSPVYTPRPTAVPTVRPTSAPTARPTSTPTARPTNTPTARPTNTPDERIYGLGDTWKVDGQWELTFDKVTVTEERNNYSGKNPKQVLVVDYTYKNIGYENDILDGLRFSFFVDSQIVDSTGLVGYDYSLEGLNSPKYAPVGASCKAQDSLGLDNKSSEVKIIMSKYDGNEVKRSATFVLPISEETENNDDLRSQMQVTEYLFENTIGDTIVFLVTKNNSDKTVSIETNATAKDKVGNTIGAADGEEMAVAPGQEVCVVNYFDGVVGVSDFDYMMKVKEEEHYKPVIDDLQIDESRAGNNVVVSIKNNGSEPVEFVSVSVLFFKGGNIIYYDSGYITDSDSEIKPGETISKDFSYYQGYDNVKIYYRGRKSK